MIRTAQKKHSRSSLLVVSSHAAFLRVPNFAVYASCKGFLNQFFRTLMLEHLHDPLDIACFCPGAMRSEFSLRANIPEMLSVPASTDEMAAWALKHFRNRKILIPRLIDRIYWLADKLMPGILLDRMTLAAQNYYLREKNSQTLRPGADSERN